MEKLRNDKCCNTFELTANDDAAGLCTQNAQRERENTDVLCMKVK